MRIILRSTEMARRLAAKAKKLLPHYPHHQLLDAVAALYGHSTWAALASSCRKDAPIFIFEQDLSQDELGARWVAQAKAVAPVLGLHFPYAYQFALSIRATSDFRRTPAPNYIHNRPELEALAQETDLWWLSSTYLEHPLAPTGFSIGRAINIGDQARDMLQHPHNDPRERKYREMCILIQEGKRLRPSAWFAHEYGTRDDFMEIGLVPDPHMLEPGYRLQKNDHEMWGWRLTESEKPPLSDTVKQARVTYDKLAIASGVGQRGSKKRSIQFPMEVRENMGLPWYWPLKPRITKSTQQQLFKQAGTYAHELASSQS